MRAWWLDRPGTTGIVLGIGVPIGLSAIWLTLNALGLPGLRDAFSSTLMLLFWPTSIVLLGSGGALWPAVCIAIVLNIPLYVLASILLATIVKRGAR